MTDLLEFASVVVSFAIFATVHVMISAALLLRVPKWKAALALVVPPLAPGCAFRAGAQWLAGVWAAASLLYVVCLGLSLA